MDAMRIIWEIYCNRFYFKSHKVALNALNGLIEIEMFHVSYVSCCLIMLPHNKCCNGYTVCIDVWRERFSLQIEIDLNEVEEFTYMHLIIIDEPVYV